MRRFADHPAAAWVLAAAALALAAAGARPYAGSWNDGCRLAAAESLVDRGTLAIDDSVFCKCPPRLIDAGHLPYPADRPELLAAGTLDKLFVNGHFYSDKPAVVSVLMAAAYRPLVWLGVPPPGERPDVFAWAMTVLLSGVGYAAAVGCLWALGRRVGLAPGPRLGWLAAFALATYAPAYTRHVNAGAAQLGVVAAMCVLLLRAATADRTPWGTLVALGTLAGFGFNLDFGTGPPLVAATVLVAAWRFGRVGPAAAVALAALPWVAAGVGVNYAVSGKWLPMNMYPETHEWPGCPFSAANLTGYRRHGPADQALYAAAMLFGKHGFLTHNLPLLLGVAGVGVLRRRFPGRGELVIMLGWCAAAWALYAVLSNNMGGANCSVRWFVPFLAPGFWLLAAILKDHPGRRADFAVLAAGGAVLGAVMWAVGPWTGRMVPGLWPVVGATLLAWGVLARRRAKTAAGGGAMSVARMRVVDVWLGTPVCLALTLWRAVFGTPAEGAARPRKILFLKLAEQGSTVLAEPALRAAAARVGRENVHFLLFAENRPILDLLGLVPPENVIAIRTGGGLVGTVVGALMALRAVRRAGIDAVVDLEFFARSTAALGYLTGARWRSGFHPGGGAGRYRGDLLTHRVSFNPYLHTAQAFALLVEALDHPAEALPRLAHVPAPPAPGRVPFVPSPAEEAEVRALLRADLGRHAAGELLLLNANASDLMPLRRWPPERYVELAHRLLFEHPRAAVVFTGAPAEAAAAADLVRRVGSERCASLAGKTTLRQLLVLDTLAEVLVTNDSGPAHFATLTPVDVVVLFGPETPRLFAGVGARTHPLWAGLACSPCINAFNDRNSACRDNACMTAIAVGEVAAEVGRVLAARRAAARRAA